MKNRLKEYGNQVCNEYIKYKPTSSSVKPVHVANGLFRLISGESYTVEALNDWVIRWKEGKEVCSASEIREKYSEAFDESSFDDDEINKLRHFLNIIFNADNAAYPSANNTVLTISSKTQVRGSVPGEASINNFLFTILLAEVDGQSSPCIKLIKDALDNENDDLSRIASPLTSFAKKKSVEIQKTLNVYKLVGVEARIRRSFDKLAENSKISGNKLLTLERFILFGCFAIINHLSSRILDLSNEYTSNDRVPMVFDADGSLDAVRFASEETLLIAKLMIEEFFEKGLEEVLKKEHYDRFSHEQMITRIDQLRMEDSSNKTTSRLEEDEKRKSYKALYLGYYEQYKNPFKAIIKATRFKLFAEEYATDPSGFITSLGGRIALLAPRAQGRGRKRYSPDPLMLEIILHTILDSDKKLTLSQFGNELWDRYGIIIGANPETDFDILTQWKVSPITPGDLAGELAKNAEKIADILISMGYGKRFADGVTVISLRR
ncbi:MULTISPECIES: hypothetical protein [Brevibacillus]|uniref:hypothetical protein n=1 Tax=Brevibacillus TaxID=55080 RepID=UPI000D105F7D|nr:MULTISPECIES: hypothetical protein [Brevibacillus]MED1947214.1 hypothetical protein [Brevibacillus formosus]MED1997519.1 hypothetical protein [Brevibacillus formosus]MED2083376.1 hypothetical protein [Brevibacillus formosus]PSK16806.1 hypothetical protein C7R94_15930 [Brevibacillus sp. NRRL NRS-603]